MPRPKIHIFCCPDPLTAGNELNCLCGMKLSKSYIVRLISRDEVAEKPWQMHDDCWTAIWRGKYVYAVCEADNAPDFLLESVSMEGE